MKVREDAPRKEKLPRRLGPKRAWKAKKRAELAAVNGAFDLLRIGCAYLPGGIPLFNEIETPLNELTRLLSEKEWGR